MANQAGSYKYCPLETRNHIRLLHLDHGEDDDPIHCTIQHVDLSDLPIYEALSYVWGSADLTNSLQIGSNDRLPITSSVYNALRSLRSSNNESRARILWADAVCINQNDMKEREQQVQLMGSIYRSASQVITYIGEELEHTLAGAQLAVELTNYARSEDFDEDFGPGGPYYSDHAFCTLNDLPPVHDPAWAALRELLRRPWSSRAWIVQESILNEEMIMVCGSITMPWILLPRVVMYHDQGRVPDMAVFSSANTDGIESLSIEENPKVVEDRQNYPGNEPWGASHMGALALLKFQVGTWPLDRDPDMEPDPASLSLLTALQLCHRFESTNPRDKIYALLGVASDAKQAGIVPNYSATVTNVYKDVTARILQMHQSFEILCSAHYQKRLDLPSWVPDWSYFPNDSANQTSLYSLKFCASGESVQDIQINESGSQLSVSAVILDRVTYMCEKSLAETGDNIETEAYSWIAGQLNHIAGIAEKETGSSSVLLAYWNSLERNRENKPEKPADDVLGSLKYVNDEPIINAYWKTLIANHTHLGDEAEDGFAVGFEDYIAAVTSGRMQAHGERAQLDFDQVKVMEFVNAMKGAGTRRRFCTTEKGYFGLAPVDSRVGDVVCIFMGAQVPFVIRSCGSDYQLVGEAYVHGVMKGEVLGQACYKSQTITLV